MTAPCIPGLFGPPVRPAERPIVREKVRRASNRDRVLARLLEGPATTLELIAIGGTRAPARVWELKKSGYAIAVDDHGGGKFVYRLTR